MSVDWFHKETIAPITVREGDTVTIEYYDYRTNRHESIMHNIDASNTGTYDVMALGRIDNELGFKSGLIGVIGRIK